MFSRYGVLNAREIESRYEVWVEQYVTNINIEAETAASIARTMLLPASLRHLTELKAAGVPELVREAEAHVKKFVTAIKALEKVNVAHPHGDSLKHAIYMRDKVLPAMGAVREVADQLERIVADDLWPLPKYSEILFIK
jgi:glutamine synthetase